MTYLLSEEEYQKLKSDKLDYEKAVAAEVDKLLAVRLNSAWKKVGELLENDRFGMQTPTLAALLGKIMTILREA